MKSTDCPASINVNDRGASHPVIPDNATGPLYRTLLATQLLPRIWTTLADTLGGSLSCTEYSAWLYMCAMSSEK